MQAMGEESGIGNRKTRNRFASLVSARNPGLETLFTARGRPASLESALLRRANDHAGARTAPLRCGFATMIATRDQGAVVYLIARIGWVTVLAS